MSVPEADGDGQVPFSEMGVIFRADQAQAAQMYLDSLFSSLDLAAARTSFSQTLTRLCSSMTADELREMDTFLEEK